MPLVSTNQLLVIRSLDGVNQNIKHQHKSQSFMYLIKTNQSIVNYFFTEK